MRYFPLASTFSKWTPYQIGFSSESVAFILSQTKSAAMEQASSSVLPRIRQEKQTDAKTSPVPWKDCEIFSFVSKKNSPVFES